MDEHESETVELSSVNNSNGVAQAEQLVDRAHSTRLSKEKKSKRQLKRERRQKPADLEGECPFFKCEGSCPYGVACRFSSTLTDGATSGNLNNQKKSSEINGLSKDVQKLLWKNKLNFPKADAKLRDLGLMGPYRKSKWNFFEDKEGDNADDKGSCEVNCESGSKFKCSLDNLKEDDVNIKVEPDIICPQKRRKTGENYAPGEAENIDASVAEEIIEGSCIEAKPEAKAEAGTYVIPVETDRSLKLHPREKMLIDFREKLYLAPLTTVGNLPFRRGQASEWTSLRRQFI
ncbi:hypothetical protein L6164_037578 [Bauhinia variegata]|uniref:Uncharacterized protein n=1 Tax=Bauhinia variegata TaxID=167791 RepID=A0ACB9KKM4_BAUVA|nr:hypothetical protein L6164_037578 [Bauhinia variegata]